MTIKETLEEILPDQVSDAVDPICIFSQHLWTTMSNPFIAIELALVFSLILASFLIQRWLKRRYSSYLVQNHKWGIGSKIFAFFLSCASPLISFILLVIATSIMASFTTDLYIFEITLKLTLVSFVWLIAMRTISDWSIRCVVTITIIPLLILSSLGLAAPVLDYLDSLGFAIGDIYFSVYLLLKTILIATLLFGGGRLLSQAVVTLIHGQKRIDEEVKDLLENAFQIVWYFTLTMITLHLVGIDLKAFALFGGAVGVGIGIGLQKIASNFISGIILLFEQSIKVGHLVEVQGSCTGWIRHLGARAAVIEIGDGRDVLVPNEELITKSVTDWTYKNRNIRIELTVKVSFKSDLEKAKKIMLEVANSHPLCSRFQPANCYLACFTDAGANFLLRLWMEDLLQGRDEVKSDVLMSIWKRFNAEGIEISIPYNEIYLQNIKEENC